jgi:hypothetical protein
LTLAVNANEWIESYAQRLGVAPPSNDEFKAILDLAAEAAHASERVAAPVACWVGARAGMSLEEAIDAARAVGGAAGGGPGA